MYSLLVDTHDTNVVFVLYRDGKVLDKKIIESNKGHSEVAMPNFISMLKNHNLDVKDISEVISVIGPGSFTGVRIGVVISKTLAYLLNVPIYPITSLDLQVFSNDEILPGYYIVKEKNGVFIANYDDRGKAVGDIEYKSNKEFEAISNDVSINYIENIDYDNVYQHILDMEPVNPHLVNPIYIKKIEVEK